jgi:hypothetical protein
MLRKKVYSIIIGLGIFLLSIQQLKAITPAPFSVKLKYDVFPLIFYGEFIGVKTIDSTYLPNGHRLCFDNYRIITPIKGIDNIYYNNDTTSHIISISNVGYGNTYNKGDKLIVYCYWPYYTWYAYHDEFSQPRQIINGNFIVDNSSIDIENGENELELLLAYHVADTLPRLEHLKSPIIDKNRNENIWLKASTNSQRDTIAKKNNAIKIILISGGSIILVLISLLILKSRTRVFKN